MKFGRRGGDEAGYIYRQDVPPSVCALPVCLAGAGVCRHGRRSGGGLADGRDRPGRHRDDAAHVHGHQPVHERAGDRRQRPVRPDAGRGQAGGSGGQLCAGDAAGHGDQLRHGAGGQPFPGRRPAAAGRGVGRRRALPPDQRLCPADRAGRAGLFSQLHFELLPAGRRAAEAGQRRLSGRHGGGHQPECDPGAGAGSGHRRRSPGHGGRFADGGGRLSARPAAQRGLPLPEAGPPGLAGGLCLPAQRVLFVGAVHLSGTFSADRHPQPDGQFRRDGGGGL